MKMNKKITITLLACLLFNAVNTQAFSWKKVIYGTTGVATLATIGYFGYKYFYGNTKKAETPDPKQKENQKKKKITKKISNKNKKLSQKFKISPEQIKIFENGTKLNKQNKNGNDHTCLSKNTIDQYQKENK